MTIREVVKLLDAEILCGEDNLDTEIHTACGSDMMSSSSLQSSLLRLGAHSLRWKAAR